MVGVSERLKLQKTRVVLDPEAPKNTESIHYSGAYMASGIDNSFNLDNFEKKFHVEIISRDGDNMVFDLVNVDAAIANALRRILISEVPTVAIEKVFVRNNTSIIQDEVLAHRLGLVPLRIDPRLFSFKIDGESASEFNTVVFKLHAKCIKQGGKVVGDKVLSSQLEWKPHGSSWPPESEKKFTSFSKSQAEAINFEESMPKPHYDDIVLAKLRPGQEIELEAHAVKGIGKTHAKWSPVATATYKMLPEVHFLQPVEGELAEELVKRCPVGVFDIEDIMGEKTAKVVRPRDCTLCRECIREPKWEGAIQLRRVKEHFIFSIESTGSLGPDVLFLEALNILQAKASRIAEELGE